MNELKYDIDRQLRLLTYGSAIAAVLNFVISFLIGVPYLPLFYFVSVVFFLILSKIACLEHFVIFYSLKFLQVLCQAVLFIYVIGDDCAIQMYAFALLIPSHYIRLTQHSNTFKKAFVIFHCLAIIVFYMISDEVLDVMLTPMRTITEAQEFFFTILNIFSCLTLLVFISGLFFNSYKKGYDSWTERNAILKEIAEKDSLTHLMNRRGMQLVLQKEYERWKEEKTPLAVGIGDIDHFKHINDEYGHDAGDLVLKEVACILEAGVKEKGFICRWGGEEFLFVFPLRKKDAAEKLENLRNQIQKTYMEYKGNQIEVTMTFGISEMEDTKELRTLLKEADEKLYQGKNQGRNQVIS